MLSEHSCPDQGVRRVIQPEANPKIYKVRHALRGGLSLA